MRAVFRSLDYWSIWLATFLFFVGYYLTITTLPRYLLIVGFPSWEIGLVVGASGLFAVAIRPAAGLLTDRWRKNGVAAAGASASAVGILGFFIFGADLFTFVILVLAQSAAYVSFTTSGTAAVSDFSSEDERAYAIAIYGAAAAAAICFASVFASYANSAAGYASDYRVALVLALAAGTLVLASETKRNRVIQRELLPGIFTPRHPLLVPMGLAFLVGAGFGVFFLLLPLLALREGVASAYGYVALGLGLITVRLLSRSVLKSEKSRETILRAYLLLAAGLGVAGASETLPALVSGGALVAVGLGILHPAIISEHVRRVPRSDAGRAISRFYMAFDAGVGLGVYMLVPVFQVLGIQYVFLGAAGIAVLGIPLTLRSLRA